MSFAPLQSNTLADKEPKRRPFVFCIHSRDRSSGTSTDYQLNLKDFDLAGEYRVDVTVPAFYAGSTIATEPIELLLSASGIIHDSSNPASGYAYVLAVSPLIVGGQGTFYVSQHFGGPINLRWEKCSSSTTSTHDTRTISDVGFDEHSLYLHFVPI